MSKVSVGQRAKRRLALSKKFFQRREDARSTIANPESTDEAVMEAQALLQKLPKDSSSVRVRKRCWSCDRPRGVYRKFGLCRICLRRWVMSGLVPGVRKSSW